jgi:hypothetical protein
VFPSPCTGIVGTTKAADMLTMQAPPPDGRRLVAESLEGLAAAAAGMGVPLVPEMTAEYNFDQMRKWCQRPCAERIERLAFLNAWNFFDD